ncbi:MAG: sulfite exporter TauE/SafE family protein [Chitinophagales bacterium]
MFVWTAFVFGLLSSVHCAGMCGPIALALPGKKSASRARFFLGRILYNSGRLTTYTLAGLLIGLLGKGISIAGYQQSLSIAIGIVLLLIAVFSINPESITQKAYWMRGFYTFITKKLGGLLKNPNAFSYYSIGILNGFLPCGVVYIALLAGLAAGGVFESGLYMFVFGLGTFPMMLVLSLAGGMVQMKFHKILRKAMPFAIGFFAVLLILRGLNLGIPYISPVLGDGVEVERSCH